MFEIYIGPKAWGGVPNSRLQYNWFELVVEEQISPQHLSNVVVFFPNWSDTVSWAPTSVKTSEN